jgi:hypothetical protein
MTPRPESTLSLGAELVELQEKLTCWADFASAWNSARRLMVGGRIGGLIQFRFPKSSATLSVPSGTNVCNQVVPVV